MNYILHIGEVHKIRSISKEQMHIRQRLIHLLITVSLSHQHTEGTTKLISKAGHTTKMTFLHFIEARDAFWIILTTCCRTWSSGYVHALNAAIKTVRSCSWTATFSSNSFTWTFLAILKALISWSSSQDGLPRPGSDNYANIMQNKK